MLDRLFCALQHIAPQRGLTWLANRLGNSELGFLRRFLIWAFVRLYHVNLAEAERKSISDYVSFNDFFTRKLDAGARPTDLASNALLSPADGKISQIGSIEQDRLLQAKGLDYSLLELLAGDTLLANKLEGGLFSTIYLSPRDYHRVHMPMRAKLIRTTYVPGKLFSVSTATAKHIPNLFSKNERLICEFEADGFHFALVLVGAMIVASIETAWASAKSNQREVFVEEFEGKDIVLKEGEEMGLFRLGSTVIFLVPPDHAEWIPECDSGSNIKVGELLGKRTQMVN